MGLKYIARNDIPGWLDELARDRQVHAPVRNGASVAYQHYAPGCDIELNRKPTISPKEAVFPRTEELFRFRKVKNPENPGQVKVDLRENRPEAQTVFFGPRPCGTRGIAMISRVYGPEGRQDPYFCARLKNAAFVTIACDRPEPTCFCTSVGSHPADTEASDVLLTPVQGGYVAEAVTDKGRELLTSPLFSDADDRRKEVESVHDAAREALGKPLDFSGAEKALYSLFDDMDFWERQAAKCIGCGTCAYLCPTCYCFNITDENAGNVGRRIRTWDNCMSANFTLEGSGHNPRPTKAHRLKNRVGHKFAYYPDTQEGLIACCGCGRCIERCPSGVDIRALVAAAKEKCHEPE
ncbi:4Fe-4S dicluster domain-containing protein [Pseudodesulfovibrio tunisiensis]|uniref:4Fe-4S dicluster domain-containing protein n=1 Tax=Pseudodesulfovibrio tunisiensis TaxID=463192 RepID=UPI001FB43606|nr:4Fe-4S dicluster domain-containing protein [Pseudodesulfovibrio tunisiensis]